MELFNNEVCLPLLAHRLRRCRTALLIGAFGLLVTFWSCPSSFAQIPDEEIPADAVPPPVTTLSREELKLLNAKIDSRKRTQLSLELMDGRLAKSETFLAEDNFRESLNELGGFHGLLNNALGFLIKSNDRGDKVDKNFKTFEMYLRKLGSRLESIRRLMPFKYGYYVLSLMKTVRDARSKAIEPLFDDTVIPIAPIAKKP